MRKEKGADYQWMYMFCVNKVHCNHILPALTWGTCGALETVDALWPPPRSRVAADWLLNFDPAPNGNIKTAFLPTGLPAHTGQQKASERHLENTLRNRGKINTFNYFQSCSLLEKLYKKNPILSQSQSNLKSTIILKFIFFFFCLFLLRGIHIHNLKKM